jgi:hypothetical protein
VRYDDGREEKLDEEKQLKDTMTGSWFGSSPSSFAIAVNGWTYWLNDGQKVEPYSPTMFERERVSAIGK